MLRRLVDFILGMKDEIEVIVNLEDAQVTRHLFEDNGGRKVFDAAGRRSFVYRGYCVDFKSPNPDKVVLRYLIHSKKSRGILSLLSRAGVTGFSRHTKFGWKPYSLRSRLLAPRGYWD